MAEIPFEDKGETLLFRESHMPKVDFYPSTGRWKSGKVFYSGGATKFLLWYLEQRPNDPDTFRTVEAPLLQS